MKRRLHLVAIVALVVLDLAFAAALYDLLRPDLPFPAGRETPAVDGGEFWWLTTG
ncbi:MAG: hypothetical protein K8U57_27570 [Planctomycetes bacterium]|nr:hypothetical protein [Planctomycetota bacterium]